MLPSHGYQGFRTAPVPSGWVQTGERWALWWSGRQIAQVSPAKERRVRVHLDARKMWQTKDVWAASLTQGKRYAERWCAVRLYPELRLRAGVARLLDSTPGEPLEPLPGLPLNREQREEAWCLEGVSLPPLHDSKTSWNQTDATSAELAELANLLIPDQRPAQANHRLDIG